MTRYSVNLSYTPVAADQDTPRSIKRKENGSRTSVSRTLLPTRTEYNIISIAISLIGGNIPRQAVTAASKRGKT